MSNAGGPYYIKCKHEGCKPSYLKSHKNSLMLVPDQKTATHFYIQKKEPKCFKIVHRDPEDEDLEYKVHASYSFMYRKKLAVVASEKPTSFIVEDSDSKDVAIDQWETKYHSVRVKETGRFRPTLYLGMDREKKDLLSLRHNTLHRTQVVLKKVEMDSGEGQLLFID